MKEKLKLIIIISVFLAVSLSALPALAQQGRSVIDPNVVTKQDEAFLTGSGLKATNPTIVIAYIIEWLLGFLGVIFVILMIYAGFLWMLSAGNEDKISQAKKTMVAAVIGLTIVLSAYAITYFVIDKVLEVTDTSVSGLD